MKLRLGDALIPYPLFTIKGRLRLSGLSSHDTSKIVDTLLADKLETEDELLEFILKSVKSSHPSVAKNFEILTRYEKIRGDSSRLPTLVVVLEGASATGKSMLALELMHDLTATRFISTDSVRQVLRGILSEEQHPELFCHTYQAHIHRQVGPPDLEPVVRGFLAQCEIITPHIENMTHRIAAEGAIAVVEGVHIQPGSIQNISSGVIEILINPDLETHRTMFASKLDVGKLRTISEDKNIRNREFESARAIQEYMVSQAMKADVPIVAFTDYEKARVEISELVVSRVRDLISSLEEGAINS